GPIASTHLHRHWTARRSNTCTRPVLAECTAARPASAECRFSQSSVLHCTARHSSASSRQPWSRGKPGQVSSPVICHDSRSPKRLHRARRGNNASERVGILTHDSRVLQTNSSVFCHVNPRPPRLEQDFAR